MLGLDELHNIGYSIQNRLTRLNPVANLIKGYTTLNYYSRVVK